MRNVAKSFMVILLACQVVLFTGCSEEDAQRSSFYITDAPIDDVQVKSVFVTITDVRVGGESVASFSGKKTIDIRALQNGRTELIGAADLDVRAYQNIELVFDLAADAAGNVPGCYVETFDGVRHDLAESWNETTASIMATGVEIRENAENAFVLDFDLRKAIRHSMSGMSEYGFAAEAELNAAVRTVAEAECGMISGMITSGQQAYDKVIAFAYETGTYDHDVETNGNGVEFQNAVTSAQVQGNGSFELHFLEEGDYELHFAAYEDDGSGSFEFSSMLDMNAALNVNLNDISVSSSTETSVQVSIIGAL